MDRPERGLKRRHLVRAGILAVATACLVAPATAGVTSIGIRPLPPDRMGTVVAWQGKSKTAVVALTSGRLMTVHAVRRQKPGTRVRVNGIKWGTPTAGIKWSRAPQGIKWGIKWARNGTFQSSLRPVAPAKRVRIRGVVVQRYRGAVAVGTRGGVVVVRQAVWLPKTGRRTKALHATRPAVGDLITTDVTIGPAGRLHGDGVRVIPTTVPVAVPTGGALRRTASRNTIRITSTTDPAFTVSATMSLPDGVDVSRIRPGTEVSATATVNSDGSLRVAQLAPNTSFAAGNDPNQQIAVPPPAPAVSLGLIDEAIVRWNLARAEDRITDAALAENGLTLLRQARVAAGDGRWESAAAALDAFQTLIEEADGQGIASSVVANQISLVSVILLRLPT